MPLFSSDRLKPAALRYRTAARAGFDLSFALALQRCCRLRADIGDDHNEQGWIVAARVRRKTERLAQGEAKDRLLTAAETLFAQAGLDGVSFRDLAGLAGVSLSAAHYHFDSKQAILAEVFERRAKVMTERRAELLRLALAKNAQRPVIADVLRAFVEPSFELTQGDRNHLFNRLLARLAVEGSEANRTIVSAAFLENDLAFIDAIAKAAPHLSVESVQWRFHFLVGAMIYTMSDSGHLRTLSSGRCSPTDTDGAVLSLVDSFTFTFSAPATLLPAPKDGAAVLTAFQGIQYLESVPGPPR